MDKEDIISNLEIMRSEIEWEYSMEYVSTLDVCIEIVKNMSQKEIDGVLPWNRE